MGGKREEKIERENENERENRGFRERSSTFSLNFPAIGPTVLDETTFGDRGSSPTLVIFGLRAIQMELMV